MQNFDKLSQELDAAGFRLEYVNGLATVEVSPNDGQQAVVQRVLDSIYRRLGLQSHCDCVSVADARMRFPDGSHKRADIAIFRGLAEPTDGEITACPQVAIEVLQVGFTARDLLIGVPFYLRVGIPDVLVFDPDTNIVRHWRNGGNEKSYPSPVTLELLCGCSITV